MKRDTSETAASNGDEALAAQQHLSSARPSPISLERSSVRDVPPNSAMEAMLHQMLEGNQEAWTEVEQCLDETVRNWLRNHPSKEAACCWESEEHYVALTFERFRHAVTAGQLRACTFLPTALRYLQACLNGVLLDSLRAKVRPGGIALQEPAHAEEQPGGDHQHDRQLWEVIQHLLPDLRERRVAYLLFQCNLSPSDIICFAPQEFSDVQEICRLRARIFERILLHSDLML